MNTILLLASLFTQSLALDKGWNAVLIEVNPDNSDPAAVFADAAIEKAMVYLPDAYDSTAMYREDGTRIVSQPVSFRQWVKGSPETSDLAEVRGGFVYFIKTSSAVAAFEVAGDPALPRFGWRRSDASASGYASFAGVSTDPSSAELYPATYFAEGPWSGQDYRTAYRIAGTGDSPSFLPFFATTKVKGGRAYGFTAERDEVWPGVVDVQGVGPDGLVFTNGSNQVLFRVRNAGTTNRTLRVEYVAAGGGYAMVPLRVSGQSDDLKNRPFDFELAPGETGTLALDSNPSERTGSGNYAGVIKVSDLSGGTGMRVQFPVRAERAHDDWKKGLFIGRMTFDKVTYGTGTTPVAAGGKVEATVIMRHTANWEMLQRVVYGQDADGNARLFSRLEDAKAAGIANPHRVSCVLMDPNIPVVAAADSAGSCKFTWTVDRYSSVNPMRHSWHPDHDGVVYQPSGGYPDPAPDGDNIANYRNDLKPEVFSITNTVEFAIGGEVWNADEKRSGEVTWKLQGLRSDADITAKGNYEIFKVSDAFNLE